MTPNIVYISKPVMLQIRYYTVACTHIQDMALATV